MLPVATMSARNAPDLPIELRQALIGQLLGDAYADKSSPTSNTRISWSFGTDFQQYAEYMYNLFADYCNKGVNAVNVSAGGKTYYRLKTTTLAIFNMYYNMFYSRNPVSGKLEKRVPADVNNLMNPITLAHLIMGDGNFDSGRNRVRIFTNSFSYDDCVRLAESITQMGIRTAVLQDKVTKKGPQYILTIGALQLDLLRSTVSSHMHSSMLYRIGL